VKGAINLKIKTDDSTPSNIKLIAFLK